MNGRSQKGILHDGFPWGSLPVEFHLWLEIYFHRTGHETIYKQKSQNLSGTKGTHSKAFFPHQGLFSWWAALTSHLPCFFLHIQMVHKQHVSLRGSKYRQHLKTTIFIWRACTHGNYF